MAPRILLCGDVLGRLSQLFKRVSSVILIVSFVASNLGFFFYRYSLGTLFSCDCCRWANLQVHSTRFCA